MIKHLILSMLLLCNISIIPTPPKASFASKVRTTYQDHKTAFIWGAVGLTAAALLYLQIPKQRTADAKNLNMKTLVPSQISEKELLDKGTVPRYTKNKKTGAIAPANPKKVSSDIAADFRKRKRTPSTVIIDDKRAVKVHLGFPHRNLPPEQSDTVFVYFRGGCNFATQLYGPRVAGFSAFTGMRNGLIPGTCVTFDWNSDHRAGFAMGQERDQEAIQFAFDAVKGHLKPKNIVAIANCRGSLTLQQYLANTKYTPPAELKAAILESPPLSLRHFVKAFPSLDLAFKCLAWSLLPSYNKDEPTILQAKKFANIPVKYVQLKGDKIVPNGSTLRTVSHLRSLANTNVSLDEVTCEKAIHGGLIQSAEYQRIANQFLRKYNLPHHSDDELKARAEKFKLLPSTTYSVFS